MVNRIAEFFADTAHLVGSASERTNNRQQQPLKWDRLPEMVRPVEETIVKNPGLAVAVAFAVGVTLACLIKRR